MLWAQSHSNCASALKLKATDTVYQSPSEYSGFGTAAKLTGKLNSDDSFFVPEKRQPFWYLIPIPKTGLFTFTLEGTNLKDDWDFMLFKADEYPQICPLIQSKIILPIRTNAANNKKTRDGLTGLKQHANHNYVASGYGTPFCKPVSVQKGEMLLLYTGNWDKTGKGSLLHWTIKEPPAAVLIQVRDGESKKEIKANFSINNVTDKKTAIIKHKANLRYKFLQRKNYSVYVTAKGYNFKILDWQFNFEPQTVVRKVFLEKLKEGEKAAIPDIQFVGDKAIFLKTAYPALQMLLGFIKANPTVKIEIDGYVNGPESPNNAEFMQLSNARTKAVETFLSENGINTDRLTLKGFGNAYMLYPNPKIPAESRANRRVEIKIKSLK